MEGISFIIFSSNNVCTIERSVKSVIQTIPSNFKHFSITIFDKTSADGTAGILKKLQGIIDNFSVVFDRPDGIEIQHLFNDDQAEYIIVLDAGVILDEGCIAGLVSALKKSEDILLAGAKVSLFNHTLIRAGRVHEVSSKKDKGLSVIRHTYRHLPDSLPLAQIASEPEIMKTMCYAIRNKDLHDLFPGGTGLEELNLKELCLRIRQKGGRIRYQPDAAVIKMNENAPPGFMFAISQPDYDNNNNDNIPGLEEEMDRIRQDLEIALAEKRILEIFSTGSSGFKGNFRLENARGEIRGDGIRINKIKGQGRIIFPLLQYKDKTTLIVKAEVGSKENTTLYLNYKTRSDHDFSQKKSFALNVFPGRQLVLFSFLSDHLYGELSFELKDLAGDFIVNSVKVYSYENPSRKRSMVSVIIPCFNQGEFLDDALDSLKKIDKEKYEVIIVNDGSDDPGTLEKFRELESRGYFVHHQKNKGLGAARNEGIRLAKGNYILPLDSDNKIRPIYIDRGIEILDMHPETGVVYGDVQRFGDSDRLIIVQEFNPVRLLMENTIDACALFRKEVWEQVGGYEENMVGYQDWAFWLAIAATENWGFYHIDDVVFDYRIRSGSMVSNTKRYHYEMLDHMLVSNISFFRREFRKLYSQKFYGADASALKRNSGHETLLGSIRIHVKHFISTRIKREKSG
jgi:glycosyltransferase involved in cell wall biosynthesis